MIYDFLSTFHIEKLAVCIENIFYKISHLQLYQYITNVSILGWETWVIRYTSPPIGCYVVTALIDPKRVPSRQDHSLRSYLTTSMPKDFLWKKVIGNCFLTIRGRFPTLWYTRNICGIMILRYMFDHARTTVHLDQKLSSLPTNNCFAYHGSGNHPTIRRKGHKFSSDSPFQSGQKPKLILYDGQIISQGEIWGGSGRVFAECTIKRHTRPVADYHISRGGVSLDRNKWPLIAGPAIIKRLARDVFFWWRRSVRRLIHSRQVLEEMRRGLYSEISRTSMDSVGLGVSLSPGRCRHFFF